GRRNRQVDHREGLARWSGHVRRRKRGVLRRGSAGGDLDVARAVRGARMTARQQWTIVGLIVVVLGGALFVASRLLEDQLYPVSVGSKAPNFRAETVDS